MGKKMMRCCALAASGAMVFGIFGGGCLGQGLKLAGGGVVGGAGFETGRDLTQTFLLAGLTRTQDVANAIAWNAAWNAVCDGTADQPDGCAQGGGVGAGVANEGR